MYKLFFKRFIDIVCSLIALPIFLLSFIICAPLIYLEDKGPVFYNADRRGRNGEVFKMYKFRSMYVDSPYMKNADGSTYSGEDDPRITKIGRLMRKTSVDELPQILNILKGDMSIVGPRPTLPTKEWDASDSTRVKRFSVRPGITGYSQAYFRNSITQTEKFKYDCYYIDNLSFIMDVKVIFVTAFNVLKRKNIFMQRQDVSEPTKEHKV